MLPLTACRKDKTLVHILNTLTSLEARFDRLESQWKVYPSPPTWHDPSTGMQRHRQSTIQGLERNDPVPIDPLLVLGSKESNPAATNWAFSPASITAPSSVLYKHKVEARKLLAWPAVRTLLQDGLLQIPTWNGENDGGEKWLTRISNECESPMPTDEPLNFSVSSESRSQVWDSGPMRVTKNVIESLCEAFFNSFHALYPILDRRHFYSDTLPEAYSSSFGQNDGCATLVLLVLALGALAKEGISGKPILEESTGRSTGVRGGTPQRPPGLAFWNEATRRLGLTISQYDLNMLQCFILLS